MTVADIKEFIKKQIKKYDEIPSEYQDAKFKQATADLVIVLGMLDELEPKEYHAHLKFDGEWKTINELEKGKWLLTDAYPHRLYCNKCYATSMFNFEALGIKEQPIKYCISCGCEMTNEEEIRQALEDYDNGKEVDFTKIGE